MESKRNHAERPLPGRAAGEPRAGMVGEAQVGTEKEEERRKLSGSEPQTAPRAGRTGGLGSRAERPSEGRHRQTTQKQVEPGRSSKAPSASASADAAAPAKSARGSDKPQAGKSRGKRGEQPDAPAGKQAQAARDSTA